MNARVRLVPSFFLLLLVVVVAAAAGPIKHYRYSTLTCKVDLSPSSRDPSRAAPVDPATQPRNVLRRCALRRRDGARNELWYACDGAMTDFDFCDACVSVHGEGNCYKWLAQLRVAAAEPEPEPEPKPVVAESRIELLPARLG
ncbi:uncharacterized protein PFL1_00754 [Pseudozyma flocculosa PF-1]|uniref:Uncharacterized protein n=1 Tax=Pseudozyma flocculosa TaxID=84751 RepID=A0A5C3F3W5_9BASI|nr:uncharacterized protein PFL1_00754 [Pseudozyma flocculosa PF-1]EPQ31419.1 hypothetical protein PFL1_00754 [Pseudozyma flocculosa PF-1]SPO38800.1 uncharacterized protein PSFLO_04279 [Pseudozyma flocculosa]